MLQSCAEGSKIVHRASKGTGLCSGKVEFCLPTKLQAPRANVSCVHARHLVNALNAFGLFAREQQTFLLDNAIAMPMLVRWGISRTGSLCD